MFFRTFSYPSSQAKPVSFACADLVAQLLDPLRGCSSFGTDVGIVMRGTPFFGSRRWPGISRAYEATAVFCITLADWHGRHPGCRERLSSSDQ